MTEELSETPIAMPSPEFALGQEVFFLEFHKGFARTDDGQVQVTGVAGILVLQGKVEGFYISCDDEGWGYWIHGRVVPGYRIFKSLGDALAVAWDEGLGE